MLHAYVLVDEPRGHFPSNDLLLDRLGPRPRLLVGHQRHRRKRARPVTHLTAILQNRCQVCHRPGTFAPMSLVTYEETRPWAKSIKQKVVTREMPPWFIDKNVGVQHFSNDGRSEERR